MTRPREVICQACGGKRMTSIDLERSLGHGPVEYSPCAGCEEWLGKLSEPAEMSIQHLQRDVARLWLWAYFWLGLFLLTVLGLVAWEIKGMLGS